MEPQPAASGHAVILDGQGVGFWRMRPDRDRAAVETSLLAELSPTQREALEAAAGRYGRFVGLPVDLSP